MVEDSDSPSVPQPKEVLYHPVTGVPEEFHDYLHKDSEEYKRLKAFRQNGGEETAEGLSSLSIDEKLEKAKQEKGHKGKPKKKLPKEIVISLATRQRKKAITSVEGLDLFGVKLSDAAKVFGKKYACGSSVVTNPSQKEQIDIQGDVQDVLPELILKQYGISHTIEKTQIILIVDKQRISYEDY